MPYFFLMLCCIVFNIAGIGEQRIVPEPTLISLENPHTQGREKTQFSNISNLKKENKEKDSHLADELKKMKFATQPDFELD